ncbi:MAG: glycosyltransferase family 39 protein [Kouleothrix sp.]|nr:glycosyltransferase family 39 protein [Kouleothrix sp.]
MSSRLATVEQTTLRSRAFPWALASYLVIGLAATLPRVLDLGRFLSGDEASFWIHRSDVFLQAIRTGDFAATAITDHPGVTTMWLGSAGLLLHDALNSWGLLTDQSFPMFLAILRLPTALTHVAGVLVGYALLRRMFRPATAALAAMLWALDPFVIAFSRVLHVDALPATFITVSLLAACLYWHHEPRRRWLAVSAVAAGLAMLSKSPSFALLPGVGAIALLSALRSDDGSRTNGQRPTTNDQRPTTNDQRPTTKPHVSRIEAGPSLAQAPSPKPQAPSPKGSSSLLIRLWSLAGRLAAWGAICALTIFALWPALWVGPLQAFEQVRQGIEVEGASPHMLGNFFLGQQDDAPGLLFYPVALALRLTPWTLLGLLALPLIWWRARRLERRDLAMLACFTLIFLAAMSLFPKKFNRYLIPTFPVVDILAAYGLVGLGALGQEFRRRLLAKPQVPSPKSLAQSVWVGTIVVAASLNAAYWHPYGIAAFNQALGGAAAGARTFTIGWGEGLSEVADWLNQQPDITGVRVATTMSTGLQSYLRRGAQSVVPDSPTLPPATGYVVVYVRNVQWGSLWPPFDQFYGRETPLHVVTIHGIDYAWIYRAPPPVSQPREADFGASIQLRGYTPAGAPERGKPLTLTLAWKARAVPESDYTLFAHLIGADGQRYAQADLPYPTGGWQAGGYQTTELQVPLPPELPAGRYRLVVGLYDPKGGPRLTVRASEPIDPALDGPDALPLAEIELR